jgi:hypothetical protein
MFKRYKSKPIVRLAYKIHSSDDIYPQPHDSCCTVEIANGESQGEKVTFVAHEEVNTGDYIVYLNEDDIYHCSAKVFAERNIIT